MRHQKMGVITCASTGIAALLLSSGTTAHRALSVPNDVDSSTAPRIKYESAFGKKLREAKLLIIDEVSMVNKDVLEYIDRTLNDLQPKDQPKIEGNFGGKVVVLGGDWKQLLPVIEGFFYLICS